MSGKLKLSIAIAMGLALVGLWAYLAGGIFLLAFGHRFDSATPLTLYPMPLS